MKAIGPNNLHNVITSAKYDTPSEVIDILVNGFWDMKENADRFFNTKSLNISNAIRIKVERKTSTVLLTKESFVDLEPWKEVNILKKGKTMKDLKSTTMTLLP
nr:unnamed protein product [Callosobruchus chinensis]